MWFRALAAPSHQLVRSLKRRHVHINSWNVPLTSDGLLKIRTHSTCRLRIFILNPHEHEWDRALVDFRILKDDGKRIVDVNQNDASFFAKTFKPRVITLPHEAYATVMIEEEDKDHEVFSDPSPAKGIFGMLDIGIPGRVHLDIDTTGEGEVSVEGAIEGNVRIRTAHANVTVEKVKAEIFDADLGQGNLNASVLQASTMIHTKQGSVTVGRAQGPLMKIGSESGNVSIRALYSFDADVSTVSGQLAISGAQGTVRVTSFSGDVRVAGVEGRLDVDSQHGNIHADVASSATVHIQTAHGNVSLGIPSPTLSTALRVSAKNVNIDKQTGIASEVVRECERTEKEGKTVMINCEAKDDAENKCDEIEPSRTCVYVNAPDGKVVIGRHEWGQTFRSLWQEHHHKPSNSQTRD